MLIRKQLGNKEDADKMEEDNVLLEYVTSQLSTATEPASVGKQFATRVLGAEAQAKHLTEDAYASIDVTLKQWILNAGKVWISTDHTGLPPEQRNAAMLAIQSCIQMALEVAKVARQEKVTAGSKESTRGDIISKYMQLPYSVFLDICRALPSHLCSDFVHILPTMDLSVEKFKGCTMADLTFGCKLVASRLSHLEHAATIGKLYRWMFLQLPVAHRPALNISNVVSTEHAVKPQEVPAGMLDCMGMPVSKHYKDFWTLQQLIYSTDILTSAEKWKQCTDCIQVVLEVFQPAPQGNATSAAGDSVGYLASPPLFSLQVRDATFRRHILTELWIFLLRPLEYERLLKQGNAPKAKKPILPRVNDECPALITKVKDALRRTGEGSNDFVEAMEGCLHAECSFLKWKAHAEGRSQSEQVAWNPSPAALQTIAKQVQNAKDDLKMKPAWDRPLHSSSDFHTLFGPALPEDSMSGLCREEDEERIVEKPMIDFLTTVLDELDAPPEKKHASNHLFQWQALRRLARNDLRTFSSSANRICGAECLEYPTCARFERENPAAAARLKQLVDKDDKDKEKKSKTGSKGATGKGTPKSKAGKDKDGNAEDSANQSKASTPQGEAVKKHERGGSEELPPVKSVKTTAADTPSKRARTRDGGASVAKQAIAATSAIKSSRDGGAGDSSAAAEVDEEEPSKGAPAPRKRPKADGGKDTGDKERGNHKSRDGGGERDGSRSRRVEKGDKELETAAERHEMDTGEGEGEGRNGRNERRPTKVMAASEESGGRNGRGHAAGVVAPETTDSAAQKSKKHRAAIEFKEPDKISSDVREKQDRSRR